MTSWNPLGAILCTWVIPTASHCFQHQDPCLVRMLLWEWHVDWTKWKIIGIEWEILLWDHELCVYMYIEVWILMLERIIRTWKGSWCFCSNEKIRRWTLKKFQDELQTPKKHIFRKRVSESQCHYRQHGTCLPSDSLTWFARNNDHLKMMVPLKDTHVRLFPAIHVWLLQDKQAEMIRYSKHMSRELNLMTTKL